MDETPQQPIVAPPELQPMTQPKAKKPMWLYAVIGVVLVLLLAGGTALWANAAKSQYVKQAEVFEQKAEGAYEFMRDLKDRMKKGPEIKATFDDAVASAPQTPQLLWLSPAPAETVARVEARKKQLSELEHTYLNMIAIDNYAATTLTDVFTTVTGTIDSFESLKAMEPKAKSAIEKLKAVTPPEGTEALHSRLISGFEVVHARILETMNAYTDNDLTNYGELAFKLAEDIKLVDSVQAGKDLTQIYNSYKDRADAAYDELEKLVQ